MTNGNADIKLFLQYYALGDEQRKKDIVTHDRMGGLHKKRQIL